MAREAAVRQLTVLIDHYGIRVDMARVILCGPHNLFSKRFFVLPKAANDACSNFLIPRATLQITQTKTNTTPYHKEKPCAQS
jgi:hypothetical protein